MIRFLVYLLATVLLISVLRSVIGIVAKFLTSANSGGVRHAPKSASTAPVGGTLRRCPACGTYTSEAIAVKRVQSGQTVFYCSDECERKSRAAG